MRALREDARQVHLLFGPRLRQGRLGHYFERVGSLRRRECADVALREAPLAQQSAS